MLWVASSTILALRFSAYFRKKRIAGKGRGPETLEGSPESVPGSSETVPGSPETVPGSSETMVNATMKRTTSPSDIQEMDFELMNESFSGAVEDRYPDDTGFHRGFMESRFLDDDPDMVVPLDRPCDLKHMEGIENPPTFTLEIHQTIDPGSKVLVVGSTPELGTWDPLHAVELMPLGGLWVAYVPLRCPDVEYKYILVHDGNTTWEPGQNRTWTGQMDDTFRHP